MEKAVGTPIAPFFRFPYLSESATTVAYLKSRNIAMFAVDVDSLDWRTHSPRKVIQRVMNGLNHRGRGIILFHDIHGSTAAALARATFYDQGEGLQSGSLTLKNPGSRRRGVTTVKGGCIWVVLPSSWQSRLALGSPARIF